MVLIGQFPGHIKNNGLGLRDLSLFDLHKIRYVYLVGEIQIYYLCFFVSCIISSASDGRYGMGLYNGGVLGAGCKLQGMGTAILM